MGGGGKGMVLDIAPLNDAQYGSALQPWKWQLTGIGYSTAAEASGAHCRCNGLWTRSSGVLGEGAAPGRGSGGAR